jgi:hypothetical protein
MLFIKEKQFKLYFKEGDFHEFGFINYFQLLKPVFWFNHVTVTTIIEFSKLFLFLF